MKIARITTRLNVGGPAIQAINLTVRLAKLGHECLLISGDSPEHEGDMKRMLWPFHCPERARHIRIPTLRREIDLRRDFQAFREILFWLRKERPDIVHTHMSKAGLLTRFAALFVWSRPKLIHTFHGHTFHSYFGKWKTKLFIWLERLLALWTDRIVVISDSQKCELVDDYKIAPANKVEVIPLGFDLEPFLKLPQMRFDDWWRGDKNAISIGIIGRLTAIKNHELFFDFIEELEKHLACEIHVIGDGERREIGDYIVRKKLVSSVTLHGWVPYNDMPAIYKLLDVVVCSSHNEGTPVTLIEAMAAGRLVIATPVGGVPDLIGRDFGRGVYLDPDNIKASVSDLMKCIHSKSYIKIIDRARDYVKENHGLDQLIKNINGLYWRLKIC